MRNAAWWPWSTKPLLRPPRCAEPPEPTGVSDSHATARRTQVSPIESIGTTTASAPLRSSDSASAPT